ncbi:MAG TPA: GAF domain-containing protein [Nocardioides sp.]|nr:GAF domain-containing protein [Nocardioides sp.]
MAPPQDVPSAVPAIQDLCRELTERLGLLGVAVNLTSGHGSAGVIAASDDRCRRLDELQFSTGEGPCYDAVQWSRPVLTPDLANEGTARWPGYTSTALAGGVEAVFAFPLQVGAMCLGVMDVYGAQSGSLTDEQLGSALTYARRATEILLDGGPGLGDAIAHRAEIYQAQGMVMVARGEGAAAALARMRAHAFAHDLSLLTLALQILAGHELLEDE